MKSVVVVVMSQERKTIEEKEETRQLLGLYIVSSRERVIHRWERRVGGGGREREREMGVGERVGGWKGERGGGREKGRGERRLEKGGVGTERAREWDRMG